MQSESSEQVRSVVAATDTRGKHRISAELKRLEQETRFLESSSRGLKARVVDQSCFSRAIIRNDAFKTWWIMDPLIYHFVRGRDLTDDVGVTHILPFLPLTEVFGQIEELELLDKMEKASAACEEMLNNVETRPDPLLPVTHGPTNPLWDRWFEGAQDASGCRCWIL